MPIYLDYNATAPLRESAKQPMLEAMELLGNASSVHKYGRSVRASIEQSRKVISDIFSVNPDQVIFTSGATESNNTIIQRFIGSVVISAVEHDSILRANSAAIVCPVDSNGILDIDALSNILAKLDDGALVSVMYANNETGVIQPIREIANIVKSHGAMYHCDAVQALGKLDISDLMQFADVISISAHKIGGPQGVGAIIFNKSFPLQSLLKGGGQERRWRGGTENIIGVTGFGVALQAALEDDVDTVIKLRDQLETEILQYTASAKVFGINSERLPNTSNLMMPNVHSETQVMNFDLAGIAVSAGAACSSGKVQNSHVLTAMAIDPLESQCSLRVSIGWKTTIVDIDAFVAEWKNIYDRCQKVDSRSIK